MNNFPELVTNLIGYYIWQINIKKVNTEYKGLFKPNGDILLKLVCLYRENGKEYAFVGCRDHRGEIRRFDRLTKFKTLKEIRTKKSDHSRCVAHIPANY